MRSAFNGMVVFMLALVISGAASRADILVRADGTLLDGKVLSQNSKEVVFQADGVEATAALHLDRTSLSRVVTTDDHGALLSDSADPATQPATARWNVPAEPTAPPLLSPGTRPTYLVIPLHGAVGEAVLAGALEKSLDDAVKRKPTVVVLDIDSPGGMVAEAEQIITVLRRYNKKLRIVALTNQDLSAAAIFSLSIREIYVKSSSTIGAATSFIPGNPNLSAKVEEKMQSAWRAVARNSAEEGKHETLLAEAMIDNDLELHLETVKGKPAVKEGHGDHLLCRKGKILTLTSHEAVECGLAAGEADDFAELGAALTFPNWTEMKGLGTLLAESLPKRADAYKADVEGIRVRFQRDIATAAASDPSDSVTTSTQVVRVAPPAQPYIPGRPHITHSGTHTETVTVTRQRSPARWKPDSLACVLALQQSEADLKDAISLSEAYGRTADVEDLRDATAKIAAIRATIFDNRNKHGHGEVAATKTPDSSNAASGVNPNPAVPPVRHGVPMPPGSVKTAIVGGPGGASHFHLTRNNTPVLGFRYLLGEWGGKAVMREISPAYGPRPPQMKDTVREIMAKEGYIAGGLIVDADETNVVAFKVIFVGYKDGVVNKNETYTSDWQGTPDAKPPQTLAGNGEILLGTLDRKGMNQDAIGLVVIPPGGKIPPPTVVETGTGPKPNVAQDIGDANAKIPDAPAAGSIHGSKFKPDRAELQGGWLTLRQGSQFFADLSLRIWLDLKPGESIEGKSYHITPDQRGGPHVRLTWMPDGAKLPTDVFFESRTMILEFGKVNGGKVSGKIYVAVPDQDKSVIAGAFIAEVK